MFSPTFQRDLLILHAQAIQAVKRALREPGVVCETVLDAGETEEYVVQVRADRRLKLHLPSAFDGYTEQCQRSNHRFCIGWRDEDVRCECECHIKDRS